MSMAFGLLGEVRASVESQVLYVGHVRQRCVLAVLLVEANHVVSVNQFGERAWGERKPSRLRGTVSSYVSRLRRVLGGGEDMSLARGSGGYVLSVAADSVDLHRFRALDARARAAGDDRRALALVEQSLELWRGEAFAGLDTPWLATVRAGLEQQRRSAEVFRAELQLRLGRHSEAVAELTRLAQQDLWQERLRALLMLALYRCGRRAEALAVFRDTRQRLAGTLGIDPAPELQALHEQILRGDPELAAPTPVLLRRSVIGVSGGEPEDVAAGRTRLRSFDELRPRL
uniref:AfsR/SARP family transcriptional regulator n=1 Tax=Amycolatopsis sp. CA-096443 TaxID=3239919 RepID=UPI003F49AEDF